MGVGRTSAQVARSGKASLERYPWSRDLTDGKPALRRPRRAVLQEGDAGARVVCVMTPVHVGCDWSPQGRVDRRSAQEVIRAACKPPPGRTHGVFIRSLDFRHNRKPLVALWWWRCGLTPQSSETDVSAGV